MVSKWVVKYPASPNLTLLFAAIFTWNNLIFLKANFLWNKTHNYTQSEFGRLQRLIWVSEFVSLVLNCSSRLSKGDFNVALSWNVFQLFLWDTESFPSYISLANLKKEAPWRRPHHTNELLNWPPLAQRSSASSLSWAPNLVSQAVSVAVTF